MITKEQIATYVQTYLACTEYELVTCEINTANEILVEVDRLAGVDVDFCAALNRYLVEKLGDEDYALEVGSVSLTAPFKTKMQYEKNLGHEVAVCVKGQSTKYKGLLVSVDEETFSVDCEEKVQVEGKKRPVKQIVTHTWRYDEQPIVTLDLRFL